MRKRKPMQNGRDPQPKSRFVRLDHAIIHSTAYRSLSCTARALLIELASLENNSNNGLFFLSESDAAARLGLCDLKAVRAAFVELTGTGLLELTRDAHFHVKGGEAPRARHWRLAWLFDHSRKLAACLDWQSFIPEPGSRAAKRANLGMKAVKNFKKDRSKKITQEYSSYTPPILTKADAKTQEDSSSVFLRNDGKQPKSIGEKSSYNIAVTIPTTFQPITSEADLSPERTSRSASVRLRASIRDWQATQGAGSQKKLCASAGISAVTLSRFLGKPNGTLKISDHIRIETALLDSGYPLERACA